MKSYEKLLLYKTISNLQCERVCVPPWAFGKSAICRQNLTYSFFPLAAHTSNMTNILLRKTLAKYFDIYFVAQTKWVKLPKLTTRNSTVALNINVMI